MNKLEHSRIFRRARACVITTALVVAGMAQVAQAETGTAVFYSDALQGKTTASGSSFDQEGMTAAHKKLKFGTKVKVTNLSNQKSVELTITDRMAARNRNTIDVTRRAARELDFEKKGRTRVSIDVIK
jgi:rare lipoprotein A